MHQRRVLAMLLGSLGLVQSQAAQLDEHQAKAVFLYNFAKFVEWPVEAFKDSSESLTMCLLGNTPIEHALDTTVRNKQVDGRGFIVRRITESRQAVGCHLLFVSGSSIKQFRLLRAELGGMPGRLIVGESEGFAAEGGVINFKLQEGRLRIEINTAEAKRARLVINSRLLRMADIVER